jgi:hypothetical protein
MRKEWVESIQVQCEEAGVPFFFKQWGGPRPKSWGRILNGKTYDEMPNYFIGSRVGKATPLIEQVKAWYPNEIRHKLLINPVASRRARKALAIKAEEGHL